MGGNKSKTKATVLENMIKNFKKGFDGDYGRKMTPGQLRTLCEIEWPSVGVGWPLDGTMDLNLIKAVYAIVMGKPGHPDQFLYIDSWLGIAQDPPKWASFFTHGGGGKILMAQNVTKDENEILQDPEGDELPPLLYWMMVLPASNTTATRGPIGGTSVRLVSLLDSSTVPTGPQVVEPHPWQAPASTGGTMSPQDSTNLDAVTTFPKLYPPLPVSTPGQGGGTTEIKQRLGSAKEPEERIPLQMPLREVQQPPIIGEDSNCYQAPVAYYCQPFSSTNILNWQKHTPSYSVEPQGMTTLIETIFHTHRPTWGDIMQLLASLFSTEERYRLNTEVRK